jgi:hypothetical protein
MITSTYSVHLDGVGPVDLTVSEYGEGRPFLLLHGLAGPSSWTPPAWWSRATPSPISSR